MHPGSLCFQLTKQLRLTTNLPSSDPHQTHSDLIGLSQDLSPTSRLPYVPLHVIQRAHWLSSRFVSLIPGGTNSATPRSALDMSIAISKVTSRSIDGSSSNGTAKDRPTLHTAVSLLTNEEIERKPRFYSKHLQKFYLVPTDSTFRTDEDGNLAAATRTLGLHQDMLSPLSSGFPSTPRSPNPPSDALKQSMTADSLDPPGLGQVTYDDTVQDHPMVAERFFTLTNMHSKMGVPRGPVTPFSPSPASSSSLAGGGLADAVKLPSPSWTPFEPFRISLEWWIHGDLKDKQRLYSRTWSYAGSHWNCYLQVVKKSRAAQIGGWEEYSKREKGGKL